jgi:hypothetical protein
MAGFLLTVVAMQLVGMLTIRWSSLLVRAPRKAMVPGVLVLSVVGTYGLANSLFDVYVLLAVGFGSYLLAKIDIPAVTIALGLVLGGIMEESFQQAALVGRVEVGSTWLYFAHRPLAIVLMLLAFAILGTGIAQIVRMYRLEQGGMATAAAQAGRGISLRTANLILGGVLLALATFIHLEAGSFSATGALFPRLAANAFLALGGVLLAVNLHPRTGASRGPARPFSGVPWPFTLTIGAALLLLAFGAERIGFYESAFLFLLFVFWLLSGDVPSPLRRIVLAGLFTCIFTTLTYLAFKVVLQIATPHGFLI